MDTCTPNALLNLDPALLFPNVRFARIRFLFEPEKRLCLPGYAGSAWRGVVGQALQRVSCTQSRVHCQDCPDAGSCVYHFLYEARGSEPRIASPPRPYIISPAAAEEGKLGIVLTLFDIPGASVPWPRIADRALAAVELAGRLGIGRFKTPFRLLKASEEPLWTSSTPGPPPPITAAAIRSWGVAEALENGFCPAPPWHITIATPLRVRIRGKYLDPGGFSWEPVFRDFAFRLGLLGGLEPDSLAPFDSAQENAPRFPGAAVHNLTWRDWHRRSSRQKQRVPMGGLIGQATITPEAETASVWRRWWRLAELFHLGKGTTMGLGKITLDGAKMK